MCHVNGPVLWPFTRPRPAFAVAVTMDRTAIARGRLNGLVAGGDAWRKTKLSRLLDITESDNA
jgi:hypothetical protein